MNLIGLKNLGSPTWHRSALLAFAALWFYIGFALAKSEVFKSFNGNTLSNDVISLTVLAEQGGKLTSLKSKISDFDYLSRSDITRKEQHLGMPYGDSGFDGVDEIWPSMGKETIGDIQYHDHGELFSQAWSVTQSGPGHLGLTAKGVELPYVFARDITIKGHAVQLDYTIKNTGQEPINGLYAFHPLFTGMTGAEIEVPDDTLAWVSWSKKGFLGKRGTKTTWGALPSEGKRLKADSFTVGRDRYWKVFLKPAKPEVTLRYPNGKGLRMTWKDAHLPYLAVWVSEGMKGLHHIGLEPTNSRFEKHQQMLDNGETLTVPAGGSISWDITITLLP